jgi:hypothetical protein
MIVIILVKERLVATIVADNKKAQFLGWAFLLKIYYFSVNTKAQPLYWLLHYKLLSS